MSTNRKHPLATAAAPQKVASDPTPAPTPTITFYQKLADDFMKSLDEIAVIIPQLESAHPSTVNFVRRHLNVSNVFLATAIAAVEQTPELQAVKKLDVLAARDALQFIEAFRAVLDKVTAFTESLKFTMDSRKASLVADALQTYDIAKGLARDANASAVVVHVRNMKRDLGRRGRPSKVSGPSVPPSPGTIVPKEGKAA